jgi:NADPH:quinone reductase-like Zn-dependent oxidoreductase
MYLTGCLRQAEDAYKFTFPLANVAEAHRILEGRKTTGKVLLIP